MKSNPTKLFEAMYKVLQEMWIKTQAEDLRIYISDANPFFCKDGKSLDPVVSEDFDNLYDKKKDSDMSDYEFIIYYLDNLDPYYGNIKQYFLSIPREDFEEKIES